MTPDEFAQTIKNKYPQYKDADNDVLVGRVLQKYPQYKDRVEFPTTLGMAREAGSSAVEELRTGIPGRLAERFGIPGAVAGTAIGTAGELIPKNFQEAAIQAGTGLAFAGIPLAARAVGPKLVSALTSIEEPLVKRAIARSGQVGKSVKTILDSDITSMAVNKLKSAIGESRKFVGSRLGKVENAVAAGSKSSIPISDLADELGSQLSNAGFSVEGYQQSEVTSSLSKKTEEILSDFMGNDQLSFKGALNLRRKIDAAVEFQRTGSLEIGSKEEALLKSIRRKLNDRLLASEPLFARANSAFAKVAENYRALEEDILSGKDETVRNRIARLFRKGSIERRVLERFDAMGDQAAGEFENILDQITAQRFSPRINPEVAASFKRTGGGLLTKAAGFAGVEAGAAHFGHPIAPIASLAGTAIATSPRLNFRVIQASVQISRILSKLGLGPKSELALSLTAPKIHDAILNHHMEEHLNNSQRNP